MIAIVAAFKDEVSEYLNDGRFRVTHKEGRLKAYESDNFPKVVVLEGGIGKDLAQSAAHMAVERYGPELMVSAGFAAGAKTGVGTGDTFVCDRLIAIEGPAYLWAGSEVMETQLNSVHDMFASIPGGPAYKFAECLTVPQFVANASMKRWLGSTFNASLIDMEGFWVNQTAEEFGVPCVTVKATLDPVEQALPGFVGKIVDPQLSKRALRAALHLTVNPAEAPRLLGLRKQVRIARTALADLLGRIASASNNLAAP
ncbi:MAG: hypothetical protein QGG34_04860 [SAR202 cluster bacterium]|jgi:nucleoside phosphorylase|nr:hypothetical protein [SAR202 cluster bacterium]MDP7414544.1 hypothetical protein [SAR202 cluster bacterium]MDP7534140.1 hypothetical protein [SAR202 cluster bacterium]